MQSKNPKKEIVTIKATESVDKITLQTKTAYYENMLHKSIAICCILFPLFLIVAGIFSVMGDLVQFAGYAGLGWYAAIVVMLAIANELKAYMPRLAFIGSIFCFVGGISQRAAEAVSMEQELLVQLGLDVAWDTTIEIMPPIGFFGLTVLFWMVGLLILGVGILRTGVFSRLTGIMLIIGTIAFFLYQGPGNRIFAYMRPTGYTLAVISYVIAMIPIGLYFWQKEQGRA